MNRYRVEQDIYHVMDVTADYVTTEGGALVFKSLGGEVVRAFAAHAWVSVERLES